MACSLLDRQIAAQAKAFENEGGFTEHLYRVRTSKRASSAQSTRPIRPQRPEKIVRNYTASDAGKSSKLNDNTWEMPSSPIETP